jgi:hypothetical protein
VSLIGRRDRDANNAPITVLGDPWSTLVLRDVVRAVPGPIAPPSRWLPHAPQYDGLVPVDVWTSADISRPRAEVAEFASNPDNVTAWYQNIESVEWETPAPIGVGTRLAFVAHFLGRRLTYTYEVLEFAPGERLVMSTSEGPFPMETSYSWEETPSGGTRMTLRNRGEPSGFSRVAAPLLTRAMRRANDKDLQRLKRVLEGR